MTVPDTTTLLTGLPRSGTTLVCALLNAFPDTVALAEPIRLERHGDRARAVAEIEEFITTTRRQALATNDVVTKHVGGVIPDNWVEPPTTAPRLRKVLETRGPIRLNKPLSSDFHLIVKHPAEFSALSDLLASRWPLVAVVRHPLAVLASWQTVDMPVNDGHMPMAEAFNPELAALLAAEPDRLSRQVKLIGWLLGIYSRFPPARILRYEDLIAAPGRALARFTPHARTPDRRLEAVDPVRRYPGIDLAPLAGKLVAIGAVAEHFYPGFTQSLAKNAGISAL